MNFNYRNEGSMSLKEYKRTKGIDILVIRLTKKGFLIKFTEDAYNTEEYLSDTCRILLVAIIKLIYKRCGDYEETRANFEDLCKEFNSVYYSIPRGGN